MNYCEITTWGSILQQLENVVKPAIKIFFSMKHNSHLKDKSAFLFCSQNLISGISFLNRILIDFILVVLSYFIMFVLNQVPLST